MKKKLNVLLLLLLFIGVIFYWFGTVTITEQNRRSFIESEFVGLLSEEIFSGEIDLQTLILTDWAVQYGITTEMLSPKIAVEPNKTARVGVLVDFVQMEEQQLVRNIITGRLKTIETQTYYVPCGQVQLKLIDDELPEFTFDHQLIRFD